MATSSFGSSKLFLHDVAEPFVENRVRAAVLALFPAAAGDGKTYATCIAGLQELKMSSDVKAFAPRRVSNCQGGGRSPRLTGGVVRPEVNAPAHGFPGEGGDGEGRGGKSHRPADPLTLFCIEFIRAGGPTNLSCSSQGGVVRDKCSS